MIKKILFVLGIAMIPGTCFSQKVDNSPVLSFSLDRYLGTWFEIARFDHSFERGMQLTTARYFRTENGCIKIVNSGVKGKKLKKATGKAKLTDTPGLLRVSFFGPFYSDYRVLRIDNDYQMALVGSKKDKYLWILSRCPHPEEHMVDQMLLEATARGYDVSKLIWIEH